jgi:hypothetical protein
MLTRSFRHSHSHVSSSVADSCGAASVVMVRGLPSMFAPSSVSAHGSALPCLRGLGSCGVDHAPGRGAVGVA